MADSAFSTDPDALLRELGWIRALARSLVRDRDTADDIAQDTLLAAWSTQEKPEGALQPWLARILRRRKVDRYRSDERRRRHECRAASDERSSATGDPLERAELQHRLATAVLALDEPYRRTLLLRYFEGLNADEVAQRERISPTTVRTRTKRALDRLRSRLDAEFESRKQWKLALLPLVAMPRAPLPLSPAPAAGATTTSTAGGLALVNSKALAALAAGILLLLLGGYVVYERWQPDEEPLPVVALPAPANGEPTPPPPEPEAPPPELPPAVDLEAADRDLDLFGVVTDSAGKPVAGANVATVRRPWTRTRLLYVEASEEEEAGPATRTAVDGTFSVRLERGDLVDLRFTHPGCAKTELSRCQAGEFVEVTLEDAAELEVAVVDESRRPVANAEVTLWRSNRQGRASGLYDWRHQTTDSEGRCAFLELEPGIVNLKFEHREIGGSKWLWQETTVEAGERRSIEVVLEAGRTLRGHVVDAETGEPIPGALVGENWTLTRAVRTDDAGRYAYLGWTGDGVENLHVTAAGYARARAFVPPTGEIDFALERGYRVRGRIVNSRSGAVANAIVTTISAGTSDHHEGTTDSAGRFAFESLRAGVTQTLVVLARGYGRYLLDFDDSFARDGIVDLGNVIVPTGQRVEGVAVDSDDCLLVGVAVTLRGSNADRGRLWAEPRTPPSGSGDYGTTETRRTDDVGRFRFPDLSPGEYKLSMRAAGVPPVEQQVTLPDGEDVLDVVLGLASGRSLTVLVRDEDGAPVSDLDVHVGSARLMTDADGRALARGLPEKPVRIDLSLGVGKWVHASEDDIGRKVIPEGQELVYVLRRAAVVRGIVLAPNGHPLPSHDVMFTSSTTGDELFSFPCTATGEFTTSFAPGSVVDVCVMGSHSAPEMFPDAWTAYRGRLNGVVAPASDLEIQTHALPRGRSATILLRDPADATVGGMAVWIDRVFRPTGVGGPKRLVSWREFKTNADGRIHLENLFPEELRIEVMSVPHSDLELPAPVFVEPDGQEVILWYRPNDKAPVLGGAKD